jgi:hypothetical protein
MLIVRMVGTALLSVYMYDPKKSTLTHHEPLNVFHSRLFDRFAQEQNPNRGPNKEEDTEGTGNQPVQR